jgi:amino acid transporter
VITARLVYGMSSRDVLPRSLSSVSPRWRTPVLASVVAGAAIIAAIVVDLLFAVGTGIIAMILVRLLRNPAFFHLQREKYTPSHRTPSGSVQT